MSRPHQSDPVRGADERTAQIRRIIERQRIETQEELVRALRAQGTVVTQATVSRDIRRLGLVKVPAADGRLRYAPAEASPRLRDPRRLPGVMAEFGRDVMVALDLILVKTVPGGAPPVAQAIDDARWPDLAGTLAGEDTIIVVPRDRRSTRAAAARLRMLLPRLALRSS